MGVSTDAILCYGVEIDEDGQDTLPWTESERYDELEEWWAYEVQGYEPPFKMWSDELDELGYMQRMPGITEEDIKEYYRHKREFQEANPPPAEEVYHCSADYPMLILAVPGTITTASRGSPERIDPSNMDWAKFGEQYRALMDFCKTYGIRYSGKPGWILASDWG